MSEELTRLKRYVEAQTEAMAKVLECAPCDEVVLIEAARVKDENEGLRRDAERLDYVLSNAAFIIIDKTDAGGNAYQLWSYDENENIIYLSGEDHFFNSPRKAIDVAMKNGDKR